MIRSNRHFCAAKTCSMATPTRAPGGRCRLAEPGVTGLHAGGVHDLVAHVEVAGIAPDRVKPGEQPFDGAGTGQLLAEQPEGLGCPGPGPRARAPRSA